jgi:hypothetical protein
LRRSHRRPDRDRNHCRAAKIYGAAIRV